MVAGPKSDFYQESLDIKKGMDNVKTITKAASHLGIRVLTLYAFSTENWGRPTEEVGYLMKLPALFFLINLCQN